MYLSRTTSGFLTVVRSLKLHLLHTQMRLLSLLRLGNVAVLSIESRLVVMNQLVVVNGCCEPSTES